MCGCGTEVVGHVLVGEGASCEEEEEEEESSQVAAPGKEGEEETWVEGVRRESSN